MNQTLSLSSVFSIYPIPSFLWPIRKTGFLLLLPRWLMASSTQLFPNTISSHVLYAHSLSLIFVLDAP
jgi:hypothetical protein